LKANKVNLFVYPVLFVFWYHSPNFLDTSRICVCMMKFAYFWSWWNICNFVCVFLLCLYWLINAYSG
jgi:hypothetical protein